MKTVQLQRIICSLACLVFCSNVRCASHDVHGLNRSSFPRERLNILGVFGHAGKSHFYVFLPLLEELARRNHDVTVISHFPRDNETNPLPNYRDISLVRQDSGVFDDVIDLQLIRHSTTRVIRDLLSLRSNSLKSCVYGLYNPGVQDLIKSDRRFDLIITEGFNSDCFLGFVHRFKAPFISLSSHHLMPWINERFANSDNPSYVPSQFLSHGQKMTFFERVINTAVLPFSKIVYELGTNRPSQKIVEKVFGPGVPPLLDIARNTSAVLVNTHFSLQGSKPDLPNVIEIGGIHILPNVKPLPSEVQRFLDEAHEGVLYFNLGSVIRTSSMPKEKLVVFMEVIRRIPRKVILKWEAESLPDKPANLMVSKWLPQAMILRQKFSKSHNPALEEASYRDLEKFWPGGGDILWD